MDVGNRNQWRPDLVVPSRELAARIHERWPMRPISENYKGEVAQRWRFDDGGGEVGFISSVSQPFCGACSRARLSSEGKFYTCLFATHGIDLRTPLRDGADDAELLRIVRAAWLGRTDRYSELRGELKEKDPESKKIEMYYIGGWIHEPFTIVSRSASPHGRCHTQRGDAAQIPRLGASANAHAPGCRAARQQSA